MSVSPFCAARLHLTTLLTSVCPVQVQPSPPLRAPAVPSWLLGAAREASIPSRPEVNPSSRPKFGRFFMTRSKPLRSLPTPKHNELTTHAPEPVAISATLAAVLFFFPLPSPRRRPPLHPYFESLRRPGLQTPPRAAPPAVAPPFFAYRIPHRIPHRTAYRQPWPPTARPTAAPTTPIPRRSAT